MLYLHLNHVGCKMTGSIKSSRFVYTDMKKNCQKWLVVSLNVFILKTRRFPQRISPTSFPCLAFTVVFCAQTHTHTHTLSLSLTHTLSLSLSLTHTHRLPVFGPLSTAMKHFSICVKCFWHRAAFAFISHKVFFCRAADNSLSEDAWLGC